MDFLFVYGTLLSGATDSLGAIMRVRLKSETTYIGRAIVPGCLFDLGDYPGMVEAAPRERNSVRGELLRIQDSAATLPWLDAYEDVDSANPSQGLYRRVPQLALLENGDSTRCWAYVLNQTPEIDQLVPVGCWLTHLKRRA